VQPDAARRFLLADDWLESDAVETCLVHDADIVSTGLRVWTNNARREFAHLRRCPTQARYDALATMELKAAYLEHFFLFRREALMAIGGVDETIGSTEPTISILSGRCSSIARA
jgi:hypothetical protein